jgi:hypothetical protein
MTTVIDPGTGGEAVVFNKSGTAILNAVVDPMTNNYDAPAVAGRVVVLVTKAANTGSGTVTLSSSFDVGDEVTVVGENSSSWSTLDENSTVIAGSVATGTAVTVKKVKASATAPQSAWIVT